MVMGSKTALLGLHVALAATAVAGERTVVIGVTGSGKSSLVNALVGAEVATVSDYSTGTLEIQCYSSRRFGDQLLGETEICDSMGFFDGSVAAFGNNAEILHALREKIPSVSSVLLVVDPTAESRQGYMAQQVNMLLAAQLAFGPEIWSRRTALVVSKTETFTDAVSTLEYIERLLSSVQAVRDMQAPAAVFPISFTQRDVSAEQTQRRETQLQPLVAFIAEKSREAALPVEIHWSADLAALLDTPEDVLRALTQKHETAKAENVRLRSRLEAAQETLAASAQQLEAQLSREQAVSEEMRTQKAEFLAQELAMLRRADETRRAGTEALDRQRQFMESGQAELRHQREMEAMYKQQARQARNKKNKAGLGSLLGGLIGFVASGGNPEGFELGAQLGGAAGGAI